MKINVMNSQIEFNDSRDVINLAKFSSLRKVIRVAAYVLRFIKNLRSSQRETSDFIKPDEVATATEIILRQEQYKFYSEEITTLKTKTQVKSSSKILKLYPFLDNEILCVGGRCANTDFSDEAKYPRIVPQKSELARLIILDAHHSTLHGGTTQTMLQSVLIFGFRLVGIKFGN